MTNTHPITAKASDNIIKTIDSIGWTKIMEDKWLFQ